jgi:hypothetical protein
LSFSSIPRPPKKSEASLVEIKKTLSDIDKSLLNDLLNIFNRGLISFFTHHDFKASFSAEHWTPLSRFCDTWDDVTHEFVDEELESRRKQLYDASLKLATIIATNTTPTDRNYYSVYPTHRVYSDKENERYKREAEEINKECPAFVKECESFVRYAKKRLSLT